MKFRQSDTEKHKIRANVDLTPLIDVVFQLLIFFMLSATFVVQTSINIEMPEAKGATSLEQKNMSLTLVYGEGGPDGQGPIYIDDEEILSMQELSQRLAAAVAERPDLRVLIRPDARVPTGRLVQIFGYINSVGIQRYFIAAQPPAEEE
jgi:biopolymer transport protein ExbD